jgi:hypothetical protein
MQSNEIFMERGLSGLKRIFALRKRMSELSSHRFHRLFRFLHDASEWKMYGTQMTRIERMEADFCTTQANE